MDKIDRELLKTAGYEVIPSIVRGNLMGYIAKGIMPRNQIRGWYKNEDEAWDACRKDQKQRLEHKDDPYFDPMGV